MNHQAFSKIWIIVIVIILLSGGILAWQYFRAPEEEVKVPEEEMKVPEEMVKDETANWQTYRNEEVGIEFKYPPNLLYRSEFVCEIPISERKVVVDNQSFRFFNILHFFDALGNQLEMFVGMEICVVEKNYQHIAKGFVDVWAYNEKESLKSVVISGRQGMKITNIIGRAAYHRADHYFLEKDEDSALVIRFYYPDPLELDVALLKTTKERTLFNKRENIFNQMLSTFRFLE